MNNQYLTSTGADRKMLNGNKKYSAGISAQGDTIIEASELYETSNQNDDSLDDLDVTKLLQNQQVVKADSFRVTD